MPPQNPLVLEAPREHVVSQVSSVIDTDPEELRRVWILRRVLNDMNPVEAMEC